MAGDDTLPDDYAPRSIDVGGWRVTALTDGFFRLDGGSMWGVVPATLWRGMTPPRDDNTIRLALRPFLVVRGDDVVLIEGGAGARWDAKRRAIFGFEHPGCLGAALERAGYAEADVTAVVATHAHWDHIGSLVVERSGALVPRFPHAPHHLPASEVRAGLDPDPVRRASYRPEELACLRDADRLVPFEGSAEPVPGLRVEELGGHSDGVSVVTLGESGGAPEAVFWGDVVPTTHHAQPAHVMAFDIDAALSYEQRSRWLARAAEEGLVGLFYHDETRPFGRVLPPEPGGRRYGFEPL